METTVIYHRFDLPNDLWAWDHNLLTRGLLVLFWLFILSTATLLPAATLARSNKLWARFLADIFYAAWFPTLCFVPFALNSQSWTPIQLLGVAVCLIAIWRLVRAGSMAFWHRKGFAHSLRRQRRKEIIKSTWALNKQSMEPGAQASLSFFGVYLAFLYAAACGALAGAYFGKDEREWLIAKDAPNEILLAKAGDYWLAKQVWQINSTTLAVGRAVILRKIDDAKVSTLSKSPRVKLRVMDAPEMPFNTDWLDKKYRKLLLWEPVAAAK